MQQVKFCHLEFISGYKWSEYYWQSTQANDIILRNNPLTNKNFPLLYGVLILEILMTWKLINKVDK